MLLSRPHAKREGDTLGISSLMSPLLGIFTILLTLRTLFSTSFP